MRRKVYWIIGSVDFLWELHTTYGERNLVTSLCNAASTSKWMILAKRRRRRRRKTWMFRYVTSSIFINVRQLQGVLLAVLGCLHSLLGRHDFVFHCAGDGACYWVRSYWKVDWLHWSGNISSYGCNHLVHHVPSGYVQRSSLFAVLSNV